MGIVSSARADHCAELTAGRSEAYPRPLPEGSPIKMCRNARRREREKKTPQDWIQTLGSLLHSWGPCTAAAAVRAREDAVYTLIKVLQTQSTICAHAKQSTKRFIPPGLDFFFLQRWNHTRMVKTSGVQQCFESSRVRRHTKMKTTFHFDWCNTWFWSSFKYLDFNFTLLIVTVNCSVLLKCG